MRRTGSAIETTLRGAGPTCVVLIPPGAEPSREVAESIGRFAMTHVVVDHPVRAFGELCLLGRLDAARAAWGLQPAEAPRLVVDRPAECLDVARLCGAIRRYLPATQIVTLGAGSLSTDVSAAPPVPRPHPLRRSPEPDLHPAPRAPRAPDAFTEDAEPATGSARRPSRPLELTGDRGRTREGDGDGATEHDAGMPAVTAAELAMLLDDDAVDESRE